MENRIPPGSYFQYSPAASLHNASSLSDRQRYLASLLAERQKLAPFMQVMPICSRLLNQEIMKTSGLVSNHNFVDHERMLRDRSYRSFGQKPNVGSMDVEPWPTMQPEDNRLLQRMTSFHASARGWPASPGIMTPTVIKKVIRLDVPVEKFPNYNFVGRILRPRGNSLKRIEAMTECRIYIRGQGSVKDSIKEEKLKDKPGYEHLNDPLHLLLEAEFPEDIIDSRLDHAVALLENLLKPVVPPPLHLFHCIGLKRNRKSSFWVFEKSSDFGCRFCRFSHLGLKFFGRKKNDKK
ncbi:KH domain-containing protein At1g09660/At1g09670-like [Bidens hawaiensis]|uniref:KH domain-containing protein At1g09660/At1g09670-like n=1 Tax=Bidens hawaiensis TaxID=980011 RepID=UPI0040492EEC